MLAHRSALFQETALNHVIGAGLLDSGFGSTPEMYKRNLIWVVTKMQVMVNRFPTWLVHLSLYS